MELISALLGALLLYFLQNSLYEKYWKKNLSVDISFSKESAVEGEELALMEVITNRKFLPLPILQMKFMTSRHLEFKDMDNSAISDNYYRNDLVSVNLYQRLTKSFTFRCGKRGYYTINRMDLVCSNLFMTHEEVGTFDLDIRLYVYPKPIDFAKFEIAFSKMLGTVLTKRFINEDPFEFCNIREYQTYDSLKAINWKASAKTASLKVNVHDYTSSQQVKILINTEPETIWKYEDLDEESIRLASTLAQALISQGVPVSVYTNARDIITHEILEVPAGSGNHHSKKIQETLARMDLKVESYGFVSSLGGQLQNITDKDYLIVISYYQKEDLQQLLLQQKYAKKDFTWIIPKNREIKISAAGELMSNIIPWEVED